MADRYEPDATVYMAKRLEIARTLDPAAWNPTTYDQFHQRRILSVCYAQQAIEAEKRSTPAKKK